MLDCPRDAGLFWVRAIGSMSATECFLEIEMRCLRREATRGAGDALSGLLMEVCVFDFEVGQWPTLEVSKC